MHRLVAILLLLSISCLALVSAGQRLASGHGREDQADHALMHWEGTPHHHDDHGATHQDDSQESIQHLLADAGPGAAVLVHPHFIPQSFERLPAPPLTADPVGHPPFLGGPRRPPRLIA